MFSLIQVTGWLLVLATIFAQAKSYTSRQMSEDESLAVIPSPNEQDQMQDDADDIQRVGAKQQELHLAAPSELAAPVYVSPFLRQERAAMSNLFDSPSESSHAPANYAPKPLAFAAASPAPMHQQPAKDLKAAASYGHHHHGGYEHGYGPSGWLDMGAWTGGKGSFGWYADYPVGGSGGKHHHGYGRK